MMLGTLFLRIFSANTSRGWRSSPEVAWDDAVYTVELLVTLPLFAFCIFVWATAMRIWPRIVGVLGLSDAVAAILFTACWLVVHVPLGRFCRRNRGTHISRQNGETLRGVRYLVVAGTVSIGVCVLFVSGIFLVGALIH